MVESGHRHTEKADKRYVGQMRNASYNSQVACGIICLEQLSRDTQGKHMHECKHYHSHRKRSLREHKGRKSGIPSESDLKRR